MKCTLIFPYPNLLHTLSEIDIHEPPPGAAAKGTSRAVPVGTGPYILAGGAPAGNPVSVVDNPHWPSHPKKSLLPVKPGNYYPRRSVVYLGFNTSAASRPFADPAHRRGLAALLRGLDYGRIVAGCAANRCLNPLDRDLKQILSPAPPPAGTLPPPGEPLVVAYHTGDARFQQFASRIATVLQGTGYPVTSPPLGDFQALTTFLQTSDDWDMFLYTWHVAAPYPERILLPLLHPAVIKQTNLTRIDSPGLTTAMRDALLGKTPWDAVMTVLEVDAPLVFLYHPDLPAPAIPTPARARGTARRRKLAKRNRKATRR
jgi:hypothetical protein